MILPTINPWLLIAAASAILVSFFGGLSTGKKLERSEWLEREAQYQQQVQKETERANEVATIYGLSLSKSQDLAYQLRRKNNEQRDQLASCDVRGAVRLNPEFVRLYNDALQAGSPDPSQLASEAGGASASDVAEVHIENGRRWKDCRLQLNAMIDVLESKK